MKKICSFILAVVLVFALTACDAADTPTGKAAVTETLEHEGLQITYFGISKHTPSNKSEYILNPLADGKVLLVMQFKIVNTTDNDMIIDPLGEESYCDGQPIDPLRLEWTIDIGAVWGYLAAGKERSGYLGYVVDENWETLEFHYMPDYYQHKDTAMIFVTTRDDVPK